MSLFSWFRRRSPQPTPQRTSGGPNPWSAETDKFAALVVKSGLRNAAELRVAFTAFRSESPTPHEDALAELEAFCDHLVKRDVLTRWQCEMLLKGRYKGFFMDTFKLLRHVGYEGNWSSYAAENVHTKRCVVLAYHRESERTAESMHITRLMKRPTPNNSNCKRLPSAVGGQEHVVEKGMAAPVPFPLKLR